MRGVGWAYEENRHEATEVQAQAPDEDLADDGELLNRISFGDKDLCGEQAGCRSRRYQDVLIVPRVIAHAYEQRRTTLSE